MSSGQPNRQVPGNEPVARAQVVDGVEQAQLIDGAASATGPDGAATANDSGEIQQARVVDGVRTADHAVVPLAEAVFAGDAAMTARYDVRQRIGKGGMSTVYLATDRQLQRNVAIKVTKPFDAEEAAVYTQRFINEARILARLNHPNIVHVYDFTASDSGMRIIMEYVEGRTLYERVKQDGPIDEREVGRITAEVLAALERIHAEGVVHRDMKPGNVMVTARGEVKVMDFGIAMSEGIDTDASSGSVVGTLRFMAPEQSRGEAVDARTDLFSVGATMAFMLLGELPSVLRAEQLPQRLRPVLIRAMAPRPADRYATPAEMRAAIDEALRAPAQRKAPKRSRKGLAVVAVLGILIGLALAVLLIGSELLRMARFGPDEYEGVIIEDGPEIEIEDEPAPPADADVAAEPPAETRPAEEPRRDEPAPERDLPAPPATEESLVVVERTPPAPHETTPVEPTIRHGALSQVRVGDTAMFEVVVAGEQTYDVIVSYRPEDGDAWHTVQLKDRGDGRHTGSLRIGGYLGDSFAYYVTVFEESGPGRSFQRGSIASPLPVRILPRD